MAVSDNQLKHIAIQVGIPTDETIASLARELLAARKVVEAARDIAVDGTAPRNSKRKPMLKLTYTPTSEIKESDLVPGSKWRRKSDGAECVLMEDDCGGLDWFLTHGFSCVRSCGRSNYSDYQMLEMLRRDFERVGENNIYKRLEEIIPLGHAFARANKVYVCRNRTVEDFNECVSISHVGEYVAFRRESTVRDLGQIEIDESVKGDIK